MGTVLVAVVDVGGNSVRLDLVHAGRTVQSEQALLDLAGCIERHGAIPEAKLEQVSALVAGYVADARRRGARRVEVLVTSPGRQARNAEDLLAALGRAAPVPVRLLSASDGIVPPLPTAALAAGGSARSLRRVVGGDTLGSEELGFVIDVLAKTPSAQVAARYDVNRARARTLAAGAVLFAAVRERLGVDLRVARGGVGLGAALELSSRRVAA
jgi:exopolyphosphatase/pppGpp-phosphohydrolase